jgi:ubiquinone/menaquinone biosynthesis C-methylase UbiE
MKQGDFTKLAKQYINRPAYSEVLLNSLLKIMDYAKNKNDFQIVEVGAGTGKLTKMLLEMGLNVIAVEPNNAMREEGIIYTKEFDNIKWIKGSGEDTQVESNIADWVIMASSFHWTDPKKSLPEFSRVLKKDGYFTAIWNPRNIQISEFHTTVEDNIKAIVPELKRVSSGSQSTKQWEYILVSTGDFKDCLFMETDHLENMSKDRYMGAWHSVNDIQVQAGEKRWKDIISMIESEIKDLEMIKVPYKIRAWTVKNNETKVII